MKFLNSFLVLATITLAPMVNAASLSCSTSGQPYSLVLNCYQAKQNCVLISTPVRTRRPMAIPLIRTAQTVTQITFVNNAARAKVDVMVRDGNLDLAYSARVNINGVVSSCQ